MTRIAIVVACACACSSRKPTPSATRAEPAAPPSHAIARAPVSEVEHVVELQLALIDARRVEDLRATFTADLRARVTPDVVEACRKRIHQVPVRPDWEMAELSTDQDGARVRRVSMFGKSLTGFHEQADGRWLADALWCVPVGLP